MDLYLLGRQFADHSSKFSAMTNLFSSVLHGVFIGKIPDFL
jgi:hypothetical protein